MATQLAAHPAHGAFQAVMAATSHVSLGVMQGLVSTANHAMAAANSQAMSLVKVAVAPQHYANLNGHEAVMDYEHELEQAGIASSITLRYLGQKNVRADHGLTQEEFNVLLSDTTALRPPQDQLALLRATMGGIFAQHRVGIQPELHATIISLGIMHARNRACAARDNIEVPPYPDLDAPADAGAAAAAAEAAAAAAAAQAGAGAGAQADFAVAAAEAAAQAATAHAAAGANPRPPPSSVGGDNFYIPTREETLELAEAIANAQGFTSRHIDTMNRVSERTHSAIVATSNAITKQRKQDKGNATTPPRSRIEPAHGLPRKTFWRSSLSASNSSTSTLWARPDLVLTRFPPTPILVVM